MLHKVTLLFGSNYGEREKTIKKAAEMISREFCEWRMSEIYQSNAEGSGVGLYSNAVATGLTELSLEQLELLAKNTESILGRSPELRQQHLVPVDVDVIIYNEEVVRYLDSTREYYLKGIQYLEARQ